MDKNFIRLDIVSSRFNTTRMIFVIGNLVTMGIIAFADLGSQKQLALSTLVFINNLMSFLSLNAELKRFDAIAEDSKDENSHYTRAATATPWRIFRILCMLMCLATSLTQIMAIYA